MNSDILKKLISKILEEMQMRNNFMNKTALEIFVHLLKNRN
jgi:hypothetical protein